MIDRDKFLSALLALSLGGAAAGCKKEPPPVTPEPEATVGAEQPLEAEPAPAAEAPAPVSEPAPAVTPAGPTRE